MKPKLINYSNILKLKHPDFFDSFFPDEELDSQGESDSDETYENLENLESPPITPEIKGERKSSSERERIDFTDLRKNEKRRSGKKKSLMHNKSRENFPKLQTKIYEGGQDPLIHFEIWRNYKIYFPNNNLSEIIRLDHLRHQSLVSPKITKNKHIKSKEKIKVKGLINSIDSMNQILPSNDAIGSSYTFKNFKVKEFKLNLEKIKAKKDNFLKDF